MKLTDLAQSEVKRVIKYKHEYFDAEADENKTNELNIEIWFNRSQLTYDNALRFDGLRKQAETDSEASDDVKQCLADSINRWSFDEESSAENIGKLLPQDLLILIIETFLALITGNPQKAKS